MSHFVGVVLVPVAVPASELESFIGSLVEAYDESVSVEPHEVDCWCLGALARKEAQDAAEAVKPLDSYREEFQAMAKELHGGDQDWPFSEAGRAAWREFIKPYEERERDALKAHPMEGKPDPECDKEEGCGGSGKRMTTYNPRSKWDWWVVGGRWAGWISDTKVGDEDEDFRAHYKRIAEGFDANLAPNCVASERYLAALRSDKNKIPFALVTPNGEWHERGQMGWFAVVSEQKAPGAWEEQVEAIVAAHPHHLAIAIDFHI